MSFPLRELSAVAEKTFHCLWLQKLGVFLNQIQYNCVEPSVPIHKTKQKVPYFVYCAAVDQDSSFL